MSMKKSLLVLGVVMFALSSFAVSKKSAADIFKINDRSVELSQLAVKSSESDVRAMRMPKMTQATVSGIAVEQVAQGEEAFSWTMTSASNCYWIDLINSKGDTVAYGAYLKSTIVDNLSHSETLGMFETYYLLNGSGERDKGWAESVDSTYSSSNKSYYYFLKNAKYKISIMGLTIEGNKITGISEDPGTKDFTLRNYDVTGVEVKINDAKTKATISWTNPKGMIAGNWIYVNVSHGADEDAIYDNYPATGATAVSAKSPLEIDVVDGETYSLYIAVVSTQNYSQGEGYEQYFTVGTNKGLPTDLKAEVLDGDSVIFSWKAERPKSLYYFTLFEKGEAIDALVLEDTTEFAARVYAGTYTWSVQGVELDKDEQHLYPNTEEVMGAEFTTKDIYAPTIKSVKQLLATANTVTLKIDAEDNYTSFANITFTVKNGDKAMVTDAKLTADSLLTLGGMEIGQEYAIEIFASDTLGNTSEATKLTIETSDDTQAPTLVSVTLKDITEKSATIEVNATDNRTASANMFFIVEFKGTRKVLDNLKADKGLITLTGLEAMTQYTIIVKAKDEGSNISEGKELTFKTKEPAPIAMEITRMQARYFESKNASSKYFWTISFYTKNTAPLVTFAVLADKPAALAGNYSLADVNVDIAQTFYSPDGQSVNNVLATDAELTIAFKGYDEAVQRNQGVRFGTYDCTFKIRCADGFTYTGEVKAMTCPAYDNDKSTAVNPVVINMRELGEAEENALENVVVVPLDLNAPMYNILGQPVDSTYRGVVIQNGHKYMLR